MIEKRNSQSGFTLIELLVVVAIIGIISSIVLAALSQARSNARDSAIIQQIRTLSTVYELDRSDDGNYNHQYGWVSNDGTGQTCAAKTFNGSQAAKIRALCEGIEKNFSMVSSRMFYSGVNTASFSADNNYSIMARLSNGDFYCIGSSNRTYEGPSDPGTGAFTGAGCYNNP